MEALIAALWLTSTSPIIGGSATRVGEFPTTVALLIGGNLCTGTLITPEWVVTAAHCLTPELLGLPSQAAVTNETTVHFATVDLTRTFGKSVKAVATFPKPGFDNNNLGSNDIGLVQLASPVTDHAPARVNLDAAAAPVGVTVTLVGFGKTTSAPGPGGGVQFALADRRSISCSPFGLENSKLLCFSQTDNKGTCSGDSGGPAFAVGERATLVGVTSFGDIECSELGAETRTDAESAFLLEHVPGLAGCATDAECSRGQICYQQRCIVTPLEGSGIGTSCAANAECDSNMCFEGADGRACTEPCDAGDRMSCPAGLECLEVEAGQGGTCWAIPDGGCCDASGQGAPALLLGGGVIALVLRRRRSR